MSAVLVMDAALPADDGAPATACEPAAENPPPPPHELGAKLGEVARPQGGQYRVTGGERYVEELLNTTPAGVPMAPT